jgi:tetratricopeptide (TPR) repeat protein
MKKLSLAMLLIFSIFPSSYSQDADNNRAGFLLRLDEINAEIASAPHDASKYVKRAEIYYQLQDYEKAVDDIDYVLALDTDKHDRFYYIRANIFITMGKYSEALVDANRIIENNPRNGNYHFIHGASYFGVGMYEEAIIASTKAIELSKPADHSYLRSYYNRADLYIELGKYQEAIADYTKLLEIRPDDYICLFTRSWAYIGLSKPDQAINDMNRAFKITPQDKFGPLYSTRGEAYMQKGKFPKALADFTRAIENYPVGALWLEQRAMVYEAMAKKSLKKSIKNEYLSRAKRDREAAEKIRSTEKE